MGLLSFTWDLGSRQILLCHMACGCSPHELPGMLHPRHHLSLLVAEWEGRERRERKPALSWEDCKILSLSYKDVPAKQKVVTTSRGSKHRLYRWEERRTEHKSYWKSPPQHLLAKGNKLSSLNKALANSKTRIPHGIKCLEHPLFCLFLHLYLDPPHTSNGHKLKLSSSETTHGLLSENQRS